MPPILIYLHRDYAKKVHAGIYVVWGLLIFVGFASAYFHATLSLMGQLLDELSILWVYCITMILFCPRRNLPKILKNRMIFAALLLTMSITASILSKLIGVCGFSICAIKSCLTLNMINLITNSGVWRPYVNAFCLMVLIIPTVSLLWCELQRVRNKENEVFSLGIRSLVLMVNNNQFSVFPFHDEFFDILYF